METIKESLLTGFPNVISYDCTKKIMKQMEKNICKIKIGEKLGTGFFCKIPFPDKNNMLPVFITNNHIIGEEILYKQDAKIKIHIKEKKEEKVFKLNNRMKYTNADFDITIIEIKETDDDIKDYLKLDNNIIDDIIDNNNKNLEYIDKTMYIIQYPEGELSVSYGILSNIYEDNKFNFNHKCITRSGSSGSPILNLSNKLIGIHKEGITNKYNRGTFLNYPIKEFIKLNYNTNNKNESDFETMMSQYLMIPSSQKNYKTIKQEFKQPTLIGLSNVNANPFINPVLHCFSQIDKFTEYFKYHKMVEIAMVKFKNQNCLSKSFKYLIENLWPSIGSGYILPNNIKKNYNNSYFEPTEITEKIYLMNPSFKEPIANDAKDLINFIIKTLHDELNKKIKNTNTDNNINQNYQKSNIESFFKYFANEYKSIMSDLFYGMTHNVNECLNCHIKNHNYDLFFLLYFPLEEVRKYKLQFLYNQNMMMFGGMNQYLMNNPQYQQNLNKIKLLENNQLNIFDCFEYFQRDVTYQGSNSVYCNSCKTNASFVYKSYLCVTPQILIIVLNRGLNQQFKINMDFYPEIDLTNYNEVKLKNQIINYDLIGVVSYSEKIGTKGNYIATCKSPIDNLWYHYNENYVFPVKNFNLEVLTNSIPCVLFYKRRQ